ncbi:MAG: hypothetical protein IJO32_02410 [Bacilli bacterium]|nr:hypothetical protein [Bacilli bacterium]
MDKDLEFIYEFKNKVADEGMTYLYHVTDIRKCDSILENGLLMKEDKIYSTTIPINNEIISDPIGFIEEELNNNSVRIKNGIIIIGCPKEELENLVEDNYNEIESWNEDFKANYVIPSEYIIGYINMNSKEFVDNENYAYFDDYYKEY